MLDFAFHIHVGNTPTRQNNSVKHPETISLFVCMHVCFEWSLPIPLKNGARATSGKSPIQDSMAASNF